MARLSEHGPRRSVTRPFATAYGKVRRLLHGVEGIHYVERLPDFEALGYRTALVPIFGDDVSAKAIDSAAKLIGRDGVVHAIFVLAVPSRLPLEAGLEQEEAKGRSVLESARIQARRSGLKIRTGLIRTRNPGAALVEEAQRLHSEVIYWSTLHAPAGERRIGPTAVYLLGRRPCRVIIETEGVTPMPAVRGSAAQAPRAPA
jgi:Universal stress protein family